MPTDERNTERFCCRLPRAVADRIRIASAVEGRTQTEIVVRLLTERLPRYAVKEKAAKKS